jgi:hypothetical protein
MQRKESARSGRGGGMGGMPRTPVYPTYTPPSRPAVTETYDSYEAEKNKSKCVIPWRLYFKDLTVLLQVHCAQGQGHATGQEVQDDRHVRTCTG